MPSNNLSSAWCLDAALSRAADVEFAHAGQFRLMIATGGVFVLRPLEPGEAAMPASEEARRLATTTRDAIARHMAWVPFVDWFVVSDEYRTDCSVLPSSLVAPTALGRNSLDRETVGHLGALITDGRLAPLWHRGIPAPWEHLAQPLLSGAQSSTGAP